MELVASPSGTPNTSFASESRSPLVRVRNQNEHTTQNICEEGATADPQADTEVLPEKIEVELKPSAYSLVVASTHWSAMLPLFLVTSAQFTVIWVSTKVPDYFFKKGTWISPWEGSLSLKVMKMYSLLLVLFQIIGEFEESGKIFLVLHRAAHAIKQKHHRIRVGCALVVNYVITSFLLVFAVHLVLSSTALIEPLWKCYYSFLMFTFDDYLCHFVLFACNMRDIFVWKFEVHPLTDGTCHQSFMNRFQHPNRWHHRRGRAHQILFIVVPMLLILYFAGFSLILDVCPLTSLLYGFVGNHNAIQMITGSWSLPGMAGCCKVQVKLALDRHVAEVTVPCLSRTLHSDEAQQLPIIHWVLWPVESDPPSSVEVFDGVHPSSVCRHAGKAKAVPLHSVQAWLEEAEYDHNVYESMLDPDGAIGLHRQSFFYLANWAIQDLPRVGHYRIFAAAANLDTGALSDFPAVSDPINLGLRDCPLNCGSCIGNGICLYCREGFFLNRNVNVCEACADNCALCDISGPGSCDAATTSQGSGCHDGFGWIGGFCVPCTAHCSNCDNGITLNGTAKPSDILVPCTACAEGFGESTNQTGECVACEAEHCLSCKGPNKCIKCEVKFAVENLDQPDFPGGCVHCPQDCLECDNKAFDCTHCRPGSVLQHGKCAPCSHHCVRCDHSGPNQCDHDQCESGFGLTLSGKCESCETENCQTCKIEKRKGVVGLACVKCFHGFGLTSQGHCAKCEGSHCKLCSEVDQCELCHEGFVLVDDVCAPCADQCSVCNVTMECNIGSCKPGWRTDAQRHCRPCAHPLCRRCESDPVICDEWQTKPADTQSSRSLACTV